MFAFAWSEHSSRLTNRLMLLLLHVGGNDARPAHSWPWVVAIIRDINGPFIKRQVCAGILIDSSHFITMAHCDPTYVKNYMYLKNMKNRSIIHCIVCSTFSGYILWMHHKYEGQTKKGEGKLVGRT